ncbi:NADH:flavin oxidoreductase [Rhodococcus sp. IEGM 248]|nr:NADH:flavin oxidoreductase [Rhodococcus sp. IEGM 248]NHU45575.1 NADH:flavin oxidoreductase [Rhodococcus sp. A14]PBC51331.1 NADH:flavin oxidoreductase [Rhodococcus sp. ACPA1]RYF59511.1 MAG: NADH:flavin oxidoreductase [Comamonadaceae bacterium]
MTRVENPMSLERGPDWSNRLVLAPLTNQQSHVDGSLHEDELQWLRTRAAGGFGMVLTCAAHVSRGGQGFPGQLAVWSDRFLPGLARLATVLREQGTPSAVQLHHGGMRARPELSGVPPIAPWDDPSRGVRAMTTDEIHCLIDDFASAARRVERAGFAGVEVHGAHGYLLCQFLDARRNNRTDGYGGTFDNRSRVIFEVLEAVRAATGPSFQVGVRLSPERYGITISESRLLAEEVMTSGLVDYLDMSLWDVSKRPHGDDSGSTLIDAFASLSRGKAKLGVAGKILSGTVAQSCLDRGADFVLIGTAAILHHDFAARVLADPAFTSLCQPVSRRHLETQHLGGAFIDYLATDWDDFVA